MYFFIFYAHQQYDVLTQLFIAIIWFDVYLFFFFFLLIQYMSDEVTFFNL